MLYFVSGAVTIMWSESIDFNSGARYRPDGRMLYCWDDCEEKSESNAIRLP